MEARDLRRISIDEYPALDRASDDRWEYVSGEAYAMSGGTPEHDLVKLAVAAALRAALREGPCLAFPDGQKVATPGTRSYHYPDALVVSGPLARDARDDHAVTNPVLLVEVASPSTADYDRGAKFDHYETLASLREYLVVLVEPRVIHHWQRVGARKWLRTEVVEGEVRLDSIGVTLSLRDLYGEIDRLG